VQVHSLSNRNARRQATDPIAKAVTLTAMARPSWSRQGRVPPVKRRSQRRASVFPTGVRQVRNASLPQSSRMARPHLRARIEAARSERASPTHVRSGSACRVDTPRADRTVRGHVGYGMNGTIGRRRSVMRTVHVRPLSLAIAVLALAASVTAQDKSPALLNTFELQQLVKRAEPRDNARLAAHFTALAERHTAEAKRHTSMAQSFVGNPSRNLGTGMSAHCKRIADLNAQSAIELRELATYHQELASGARATPPAGSARFEGGAGAPAPTDEQLKALASKASIPADHHASRSTS